MLGVVLLRLRAGPRLTTQADGTCPGPGARQEHVEASVSLHWGWGGLI